MTEKPTKSPEEKTTLETEEKKPARWSFLSGADGNTLVFKRSHLYAVLLPLTFIVGLSVGYLFWGRRPAVAQPQAAAQAQQQDQQNVQRYDVPVDDDPALGPANAPITIIEFSDYECPYCRRWHTEVFNQLRQEYGDKIRFVYRDFPLSSIHPDAEPAAEAANCANEQGAFWQYHDLLFSGIDSGRYSQEVQADYQYASQLGVRSTPTFFINGLPVVGAQPYDVFKQVIDQELAGEIP
jgi:protein-disulfide isomerase